MSCLVAVIDSTPTKPKPYTTFYTRPSNTRNMFWISEIPEKVFVGTNPVPDKLDRLLRATILIFQVSWEAARMHVAVELFEAVGVTDSRRVSCNLALATLTHCQPCRLLSWNFAKYPLTYCIVKISVLVWQLEDDHFPAQPRCHSQHWKSGGYPTPSRVSSSSAFCAGTTRDGSPALSSSDPENSITRTFTWCFIHTWIIIIAIIANNLFDLLQNMRRQGTLV